jgi:hypothetical protein
LHVEHSHYILEASTSESDMHAFRYSNPRVTADRSIVGVTSSTEQIRAIIYIKLMDCEVQSELKRKRSTADAHVQDPMYMDESVGD